MRELNWMARAKSRDAWDRTAELWSLLANANSDPKQRTKPYHPADVHPYRDRSDYPDPAEDETPEERRERHRDRRLAMLPVKQRRAVMNKLKQREDQI